LVKFNEGRQMHQEINPTTKVMVIY
jgi:hypothetical protein